MGWPEKKGMIMMNQDYQEELLHLESCLSVIQENIRLYEAREQASRKEVTALFQAVRKGEGDSYGQLVASQNILEHVQNTLRKNRSALDQPYFGRIVYDDLTYKASECCYIGKNGISKNQTDVIVVDWRAPVANVYYENSLGNGHYAVPGSSDVEIDLHQKRTYDISDGTLHGYYDDDIAANDDLLVKYLSQNKDAVLGDIIATIQKEQNTIIRDLPSKNIIVQGVAGSGKTTVALHRISYLLYNYEDLYKPSEFCIIGSSDMLLHYIRSGLPELDVHHIHEMRMDEIFPYLMEKAWKKQYQIVPDYPEAEIKSHLPFIRALDRFLAELTEEALNLSDITDPDLGVVLSLESMLEARSYHPEASLYQFEKHLNERLLSRLKFLCTERSSDFKKAKRQAFRKYFDSSVHKWTVPGLYLAFLTELEEQDSSLDFSATKAGVSKGKTDVYDAAAFGLIYRRIFQKQDQDVFSQIFIDEAQDFGETVYYVLKQMLHDCYFTIMGDVSQNIRYETGMNDWEQLKEAMFDSPKDSFYLLLKSYRNTIEISRFAGQVLQRASQGGYQIDPVIRHGQPVSILQAEPSGLFYQLQETLRHVREKKFETIAVICRTPEEAAELKSGLGIPLEEDDNSFHNGVMVLPVSLTKGLEFDCVILWKPDEDHYQDHPKDAKLLYVAITRALHELYLLTDRPLTPLLLTSTGSESVLK